MRDFSFVVFAFSVIFYWSFEDRVGTHGCSFDVLCVWNFQFSMNLLVVNQPQLVFVL